MSYHSTNINQHTHHQSSVPESEILSTDFHSSTVPLSLSRSLSPSLSLSLFLTPSLSLPPSSLLLPPSLCLSPVSCQHCPVSGVCAVPCSHDAGCVRTSQVCCTAARCKLPLWSHHLRADDPLHSL